MLQQVINYLSSEFKDHKRTFIYLQLYLRAGCIPPGFESATWWQCARGQISLTSNLRFPAHQVKIMVVKGPAPVSLLLSLLICTLPVYYKEEGPQLENLLVRVNSRPTFVIVRQASHLIF